MVARFFWKIYWKLAGWSVKGNWPKGLNRAIIVVGPHTSWADILVGMAARSVIPIPHAHFLGKKELFDGPFGWFFRATGGVPVDRFSKNNMVEQVVEEFHKRDDFVLALSPEGTRKKVDRLRTGFWHIAKLAGVPIVMAGMDFANKTLILSEAFMPGIHPDDDMPRLIGFFAPIKGKHPELGMGHLAVENQNFKQ
ncbi:1-acyl-sn-glycerol-3-phosphate acyltransferase [Flavihumibacter profundi]|uniref:1-acyl-sn-glycerol-3-phosphate acyltransferase n=1 Tax=Flavihumibacter profundi TaxID=2716883 RepID=UPI001CC71FFA|nr:1-acyl-sn-glycerol-3-phosphate acyltransferase [Flavihumibacter profundi]MBZ5857859.1 1-acyl-sn-glycerol-3-phosphate acyltransferase [Flavihumibacter profundi]